MIMRDQRPKMNHTIFVKRDAIQVGNTGHINQRLDAFADAALEFEDQIGRAGYDAGALAVSPREFLGLHRWRLRLCNCATCCFLYHKNKKRHRAYMMLSVPVNVCRCERSEAISCLVRGLLRGRTPLAMTFVIFRCR